MDDRQTAKCCTDLGSQEERTVLPMQEQGQKTETVKENHHVLEILEFGGVSAERIAIGSGSEWPPSNVKTKMILTLHAQTLTAQATWRALTTLKEVQPQSLIHYPKNWWQAFRERWFPMWWLDRYPIKNNVSVGICVSHNVCPHLPITPQSTHHQWLVTSDQSVQSVQLDRNVKTVLNYLEILLSGQTSLEDRLDLIEKYVRSKLDQYALVGKEKQ